ncbi:hypothetical protein [Paucisalibacillus sp. EB02]|uniref:hypothetical protein n=1 Tax=Paucisalibacillus sp. EB02 TaxID=1347087 RepID=UPI0004B2A188|nr:hypothetical protein [Paucisalibacillus sp. EB02]
MKKKILTAVLAGALCIGTLQLVPVIAGEKQDNTSPKEKPYTSTSELRADRDTNVNNDRLTSLAEEYGISLEGKDLKTVQEELRNALLNAKASELGISTEGKSLEELMNEFKAATGEDFKSNKEENTLATDINDYRMKLGNRNDLLKDMAKEYGIELDEKNPQATQQEVLEKMINEKAAELGISTEGKDFDTLKEELQEIMDRGR